MNQINRQAQEAIGRGDPLPFSFGDENGVNGIGWDGLAGNGFKDNAKWVWDNIVVGDSRYNQMAWQSFAGQMKTDATIVLTVANAPIIDSVLFARSAGLLNNNPYVRIGWGWKGNRQTGYELFRIATGQKGSADHFHFDFFDLFKR